MIVFEILIFGFTLWLGAYLISRNPGDLRLVLAGTGLIAYGLALAFSILASYGDNRELNDTLVRWQGPLLILPLVCWLLLLFHLLRTDESWYSSLRNHRNPYVVVITASVFFGLGVSLLIVPSDWIPRSLLLLGAKPLATFTGIEIPAVFIVLGTILIIYAIDLWWVSSRDSIDRRFAWAAIILDILWVAGSVVIIASGWPALTVAGRWAVFFLAEAVALFAILQYAGLRRVKS